MDLVAVKIGVADVLQIPIPIIGLTHFGTPNSYMYDKLDIFKSLALTRERPHLFLTSFFLSKTYKIVIIS